LKVKKNLKQIAEEDIEKVLKSLQDINAEFVNIDDRAVQMGDHIVCDMESMIDGKPQEAKKNIWFSVDDKFKIKGFCDQLVGAKAGQTKDVEVTLPEDYPAKEFAGKKAVFKVKVNQIKQKKLHSINDEFAKHLGKFQNLSELRQGIHKDLEASAERDALIDTENQLLDQLVKDSFFEIPDSLVDAQTKRLVEHAKHDLRNRGFTEEQMKAKEPELHESLKNNAQRQVRIYFILEEVANTENITVTQSEVDKGIRDFAQRTRKSYDEVKNYLQEKDMMDDFVAELREEKTIQFLLQNAQIT
jgi:trigger factor